MSLALRPIPRPSVRIPGGLVKSSDPLAGKPAAGQPTPPPIDESLLERLVKLIPADAVALYVPALGFRSLTSWPYYSLAIAIGGTLLVPLLLFLDARPAHERVPPLQYVVRTLAFISWALVIGEPLGPGVIHPVIPALVAIILPVIGEKLLRIAQAP